MIKCSSCGSENQDGTKFCAECGKEIEAPAEVAEEVTAAAPEETPAEPKKKKNVGKIIGIIVAVLAVIAILVVVLFPTILRAILGESKYYLYRESKALTGKYKVSDVSLKGLEKSEIRIDYKEDGEAFNLYGVLSIGEGGKTYGIDFMMTDGDELFGTLQFCDEYMTLSIPLLFEETYYIDYKAEEIDDDDTGIIKAITEAVKAVDVSEYITTEKDGNKVVFSTDNERILKYIDALIAELNKSQDYKDLISKVKDFDEDVYNLLAGIDKAYDEYDPDYNNVYRYEVIYLGRNDISSRELFVDDESAFKIYANENGELVFANEYLSATLSTLTTAKVGNATLPVLSLVIKEDDSTKTIKLDATDKTYAFSLEEDGEKIEVVLEKIKDIDKYEVASKDSCTLLDDEEVANIVGSFFGTSVDY